VRIENRVAPDLVADGPPAPLVPIRHCAVAAAWFIFAAMTEEHQESEAADDQLEAVAAPLFPNDTLAAALTRHGIVIPNERQLLLDRYCHQLWEWNEKINLTRHTDYERFVSRDLVDTLQLSELIQPNEEVIEIGSGGGVPGLVLALLRPDLDVTLTESVGKKARALTEIVKNLRVKVRVEGVRAEKALVNHRYDVTVVRGVGPLWKILTWLKPHWLSVGRLLAIKGPKWTQERGEARHRGLMSDLDLRKAAEYPLAGTESQSVILKIWPAGALER
jgi:16S rRNA (guanine527-N7)-methyltransferase